MEVQTAVPPGLHRVSRTLCVMGSVNSLANKMDELAALAKNVKLYRERGEVVQGMQPIVLHRNLSN